jgi:flavodoxin
MNAIVVYESIYGNTRAVAEAVAEGLGGAEGHDTQPPDGR